jgi:signal transduction histidine kinase
MNSIRKKLFFYIGGMTLLLVGLLLLANTLLLEPYYMSKEKEKLLDTYDKINALETDDYEDSLANFVSIESSSNIDIILRSVDGELLYSSKGYFMEDQMGVHLPAPDDKASPNVNPPGNKPPEQNTKVTKSEIINDKVSVLWATDLTFDIMHFVLDGTLDNGTTIMLRIPMTLIETNIEMSNRFTIIIGLILLLISLIYAYYISNYFTKPILRMNIVTKRMKNLDFDTMCVVSSDDEIGQLAESVNEMSLELSETIDTLNSRNDLLNREVEEKIKLDLKRRELLNNVSHELKSPLALMRGYAEGLKLNVSSSREKTDFYCDVIMDETIKMNQLVESLLDINQMEFGDKPLNKTAFEANDFIESMMDKYQKICFDKKISCSLKKTKASKVYADEFRMESVFTNYLSNAINYVDENKEIEISIKENEDKVRIEVFNTAETIDQEDLDKIWNSFYKVDKARTREKGGHGLGLSIVKAIQEAHGNGYGAYNSDGGVCFWFEMDRIFDDEEKQ